MSDAAEVAAQSWNSRLAYRKRRQGELTARPAVVPIATNPERPATFVDRALLRMEGNDSHRAGDRAQEGADRLACGPLSSGMFGEFDAAEAFHEAVSSAHALHITNLQAHHQSLTAVGANAHRAAAGFTDMDDRSADEMRAVRPASTTTARSS